MEQRSGYDIKQSLYKYEVANKLDVSMQTLRKWLNERYYKDLYKLGYRKNDRRLNPRVLSYLFIKLDFD